MYGRKTEILCDNKPSVDGAIKTKRRFLAILGGLINDTHDEAEFLPKEHNPVGDFPIRFHAPQIYSVNARSTGKEPYLEHIKERQRMDPAISAIRHLLAEGPEIDVDIGEYSNIRNNLLLHNGIVFVRDNNRGKVLIPNKGHLEFVINTHNDKLIGHVGLQKLEDRINDVAYVPRLKFYLNYIKRNCGRCKQTADISHAKATFPIQDKPVPDI